MMYYPIDETTARRAHEMMSMRDYTPGTADFVKDALDFLVLFPKRAIPGVLALLLNGLTGARR